MAIMGIVRLLSSAFIAGALLLGQVPRADGAPTGDELTEGTATETGTARVAGNDGATYELRGGATVKVSPGAVFAFEKAIRLKLRKPGDTQTLTRTLRLDRGSVEITIPSAGEPTAVLVRSSSKVSGVVKEGRAAYVVQGDRVTIASREGEMLVGVGAEWKALRAGLARTLAPDDPQAAPRPVPEAPTLRTDRAMAVVQAQSGETASVRVRWSAAAEASRYAVQLHRVDGGRPAPLRMIETSETQVVLDGLDAGVYAVSARTVDRHGLSSLPSAPAPFRVLGVELPEGSVVTEDRTILLGKDQRVGLQGVDGVEVSYGASPLFIAAPAALGLSRGAETRVRLRARGDTTETELRLAPKALRARVELSPRTARWPGDPVSLSVELYDASDRPVPADTKVSTTVTVNSEPADVKWERSGRTLRAVLPPSSTEGPWVVRVEVRDLQGELLGRNFLEIAPALPAAKVAQR